MSYRLGGQQYREIQPSFFNELGDRHRKEREQYMGIIGAGPPPKNLAINYPLESLNTLGARPNPGTYHTGLLLDYENTFSKRLVANFATSGLEKDGNPYHDRYVFNYDIQQKTAQVPLNSNGLVGGRGGMPCECELTPCACNGAKKKRVYRKRK